MQLILLIVFVFAFVAASMASPAADHKHRHHGKHHRKSSDSKEDQKRTLPPNIWALLASNKSARDDSSGPKYNNDIEPDHDLNEIADDTPDFELSNDDDESVKKVVKANCPKCKQNSVKMSEDELANLRIEYVKNQILHKLRMTERPAPVAKDELPEPIQEGYAIHNDEDNTDYLNRHLDDYFAKTTQKIIFLTQDHEKCKSHESKDYPSECFSFQIPSDVDVSTVESAQLWVYKEPDSLDYGSKQTFLLSEIGHWGSNLNFTKTKPIAIREIDQGAEEWEKIDIAWPVKNWVEFHDLSHTIQVACETCSGGKLPISMHHDRKPFIVIDTFPQRTISRQARNVNCGPGSNECCRDSLYIDFSTIGWDDWIIHPKGYNAYFCRGTCDKVASITKSGAHHSTVLNKFLHHDSGKKKLELVPCCTATRYSSLQILYIHSNKTATQVTLPNMIVESCGCS